MSITNADVEKIFLFNTRSSKRRAIGGRYLLRVLNSRRATSPLVRLVEGELRWDAPDHHQGALSLNWGETELNRSITCMVFKAKANDRRPLALCHDEFSGP
ncbi:uncharacterized protein TNCV_2814881 [Trichonephila clavipes]|nr:uncharacterized protein TNCV_2814881 [Trichonephila clavipes]